MADKFFAVTRIQFGERVEDGSQDGKYKRTTFEVDDEVKGLDKDTMKDLWGAGALRREKGSEDEKSTESDKSGGTSSDKPTGTTAGGTKVAPAKATTSTTSK